MTLTEYAEVIGSKIEITGHCDKITGRPWWSVKLRYVSVVDGAMLSSTYGRGTTPRQAARDYCVKIQGKPICVYKSGEPELRTTAFHTLKPY